MSDRSECGLRIYRAERGEIFVIFSVDGESYGMSPTNVAENLATAVLHIFSLDPAKTTWLERYAKSSGEEQESCDSVEFEFDPAARVYSNPSWRRVKTGSAAEYLRNFGIEW